MSRLEKYIKDNREAFDEELPTEKLWEKIGNGITQKQGKLVTITPLLKWSAAAAVVIIAGTALVFILQKNSVSPSVIAVKEDTVTDIASVSPEAVPEVNQFAKLIALKQEELKALSKEQPELYQKFTTDIDQLDSSYRTLKNRLSMAPNREMLIEAMVQNLQLQLNVLNQQLNIINQIKQSKKYSDEKGKNFM